MQFPSTFNNLFEVHSVRQMTWSKLFACCVWLLRLCHLKTRQIISNYLQLHCQHQWKHDKTWLPKMPLSVFSEVKLGKSQQWSLIRLLSRCSNVNEGWQDKFRRWPNSPFSQLWYTLWWTSSLPLVLALSSSPACAILFQKFRDFLLGIGHPCLAAFSIVTDSAGSGFSIH
jgi:hypothetical protein